MAPISHDKSPSLGEDTDDSGYLKGIKAELTNILGRAQDLPDFCDFVHASGQAKVHDANVPQRSGTGQQDVLGLQRVDRDITVIKEA